MEKEIHDKELKSLQLKILNVVVDFCDRHDIKYWLDFGTLLGSVRHGGYIPWDDDIDLGMLRKDYDKFINMFNGENERYQVKSFETDNNFYYAFAKVLDTKTVLYEPDRKNGVKLCVNIDIFPYDTAPDKKSAWKMIKKRDRLNIFEVARRHSGRARGSFIRRMAVSCLKAAVKVFPPDYFIKRIVKNAKKFKGEEFGYVTDFSGNDANFICEKNLYDEMMVGKFESGNYKIPKEYDTVLRKIYGDYMILPPAEKRVTHHKYEAYYLE